MNDVPRFAVVGRVNAGKTATLATLLEVDDQELLRVSETPGETTQVQELPVRYRGDELVRFLDTPGFQQPVEAMRRIRELAGVREPGPEEIRRFVRECGNEFPDEVRLLLPIIEGAGVLYVVDPSNPLRDSFLAEMEILRWTGRPRLALLNPQREVSEERENEWRVRLGGAFNLVRSFNAHLARYGERRRLLESLLHIDESHQEMIRRLLNCMDQEWEDRREQAVEAMIQFLEQSLLLRVYEPLDERDAGVDSRIERKKSELSNRYFEKLADIERRCVARLLKLYRHHLLQVDHDPSAYHGLDLALEETWRKWGLTRIQLSAAGALAGGAAGAMIDLGVGGHSFAAGAVFGAIGGGVAAFFKGGSLPDLKVKLGGLQLSGGDAKNLVVGPPSNPNFPWVLLDSVLYCYQGILSRAHGRRERLQTVGAVSERESLVRGLSSSSRATLQKWFTSCLKGGGERSLESSVFEVLVKLVS